MPGCSATEFAPRKQEKRSESFSIGITARSVKMWIMSDLVIEPRRRRYQPRHEIEVTLQFVRKEESCNSANFGLRGWELLSTAWFSNRGQAALGSKSTF